MKLAITQTSFANLGGPIELHLDGSICFFTRQALLDAARAAIFTCPRVTIDAAGVDFVDSTGICALLDIVRLAQHEGATLELTPRSRQLQYVLDRYGFGTDWPN